MKLPLRLKFVNSATVILSGDGSGFVRHMKSARDASLTKQHFRTVSLELCVKIVVIGL